MLRKYFSTLEYQNIFDIELNSFRSHWKVYYSFSNLEKRLFGVAPSDNPSVTGIGPALALDGWDNYQTIPLQDIDDYETNRRPRVRIAASETKTSGATSAIRSTIRPNTAARVFA